MTTADERALAALTEERRRAREALAGAASSSSASTDELRGHNERIKQVDLALAEFRRGRQRTALVVGAAIVAVVVTGLSTLRVPTTAVDVTVEASAVEMVVGSDGVFPLLALQGPVSVSGIAKAKWGDAGKIADDGDLRSVHLKASQVILQQASIRAGSMVRIESIPGAFELAIASAAPGTDMLLVGDGAGEFSVRYARQGEEKVPLAACNVETFELSRPHAGGGLAPAVRVTARALGASLQYAPRDVREVHFRSPVAPQSTLAASESSVRRATIKVGPKPREVAGAAGDAIVFKDLKVDSVKVELCGSAPKRSAGEACTGMSIRVIGKAGDVQVGRPGNLNSVKQSWLEYFKDSSLIGLLWGAAVFLWGTGWSVWRAFAH